jgi:hypothetical protein
VKYCSVNVSCCLYVFYYYSKYKYVLIFVLSYILKSEECFPSSYDVKNSNYCTEVLYIYFCRSEMHVYFHIF